MIVRKLKDIKGSEHSITPEHGNWTSDRFLLKQDGMGFSMSETIIRAGTETFIWYKNHLEAVYCVGGEGEIEDLSTGTTHQIADGTLYALDGHEKHYLRAFKDMRMICVFNPPLTGKEVHTKEGFYPLMD
ncbi:MAG: ectoine synthase [bacterium]|nr:ectoine synthase [bacterium]